MHAQDQFKGSSRALIHRLRRHRRALGQQNRQLREAARSAGVGIIEYGESTPCAVWDNATYKIYGVDQRVEPSRALAEALIHPEDLGRYHLHMGVALDPAGPGTFDFTHRIIRRDTGKPAFISTKGKVRPTGKGAPRISTSIRDVTEEHETAQHLGDITDSYVQSDKRRQAAIAAAKVGIWEFDVKNQTVYLDDWSAKLIGWGQSAGVATSAELRKIIHPDDLGCHNDLVTASLSSGAAAGFQSSYRITRADSGQMRWISASGEVVFRRGDPVAMRGTIRDITEEKRATDELELMNRELQHRAKNMYATVNAMIRISSRGHPHVQDFAEKISGRLGTLSEAHLISMHRGQTAEVKFRDLLETILAPYAAEDKSDLIKITGGKHTLLPATVSSIGMILHELATNAVKYGGLSGAGQGLAVTIEPVAHGEAKMVLIWREHCPLEDAGINATCEGFGSKLMSMSARQINADLSRTWHKDGLEVRLTLPI